LLQNLSNIVKTVTLIIALRLPSGQSSQLSAGGEYRRLRSFDKFKDLRSYECEHCFITSS